VTSSIQTHLDKCATGVPFYAGYIGSTGTVIRDNGFYSFTVSKTLTGVYVIKFGTALPSNQYSVSAVVRNTLPISISYSNQTASACNITIWDCNAVAADSIILN